MTQERAYELPGGLTVTRMQPAIGAVVTGLDASLPLSDEQAENLRAALFAHGVIFLPGQHDVEFEQHLALAEAFGTPVRDGPDPDRPMITPIRGTAGSKEGTACTWHSDGCYQPEPPAASILRAIEPCTFGGDTCWSSGIAAYANLPEDLRDEIAELKFSSSLAARMPKDHNHFGTGDKWNELREKYPTVYQPVVSVHPVTGARALYANRAWSIDIVGMDDEAGQALIGRLADEFTRPEYQVRWNWAKGDIAIWDNRIVQHYGVPDHTTDRYLERITVQGGPILSIADWGKAHSDAKEPA